MVINVESDRGRGRFLCGNAWVGREGMCCLVIIWIYR